ncbi:MAG TPA: cell division protein ZapE [Chloroflexota bacterium]|jgi:cell division protein ZapE
MDALAPRVPRELSLDAIPTDAMSAELVRWFVPTPRFAHVSFASYHPDPAEPTQAAARARVEEFVAALAAERPLGGFLARLRGPRRAPPLRRLYLDGGFGVGKTHLLAAAYHAAPAPKSYLSFAELAYTITSLGMASCLAAFRAQRLLCIDEFELDDVANTRLAATFLRGLRDLGGSTRIVTTSNTLPTDLGAGRFAADDFRREIGEIASVFETVHIAGDDYRHRPRGVGDVTGDTVSPDALQAAFARYAPRAGGKVLVRADAFIARLATLHPIRYVRLLAPIEALFVEGLEPFQDQDTALRFVHLVDKVYDQEVRLVLSTSCPLFDLFPAAYRTGGYRKKYERCLSRLHELLAESAAERAALLGGSGA